MGSSVLPPGTHGWARWALHAQRRAQPSKPALLRGNAARHAAREARHAAHRTPSSSSSPLSTTVPTACSRYALLEPRACSTRGMGEAEDARRQCCCSVLAHGDAVGQEPTSTFVPGSGPAGGGMPLASSLLETLRFSCPRPACYHGGSSGRARQQAPHQDDRVQACDWDGLDGPPPPGSCAASPRGRQRSSVFRDDGARGVQAIQRQADEGLPPLKPSDHARAHCVTWRSSALFCRVTSPSLASFSPQSNWARATSNRKPPNRWLRRGLCADASLAPSVHDLGSRVRSAWSVPVCCASIGQSC